jgi:3-oxoacyl-[acyl-carrier-protein] synthase-3
LTPPATYIRSVGASLGDTIEHPPVGPEDLCVTRISTHGGQSVRVSALSGPELAVMAGQQAIHRSGLTPADIGGIFHSSTYYQGHDMWSPASFVGRELGVGGGLSCEIKQVSAGGLVALDVARRYVECDPSMKLLVTTGDRFDGGFDRWCTDPGTAYGDGGTAAVISSEGIFRVMSTVVAGDPTLEGMHRDVVHHGRTQAPSVVDLGSRQRRFLSEPHSVPVSQRLRSGLRAAHLQALKSAGVDSSDIARFVLPNFGARRMKATFFGPLSIPPRLSTLDWGRDVGHLGSGDQFGGLAHLVDSNGLTPGDLIELIAVGAGFTWAIAIIRYEP